MDGYSPEGWLLTVDHDPALVGVCTPTPNASPATSIGGGRIFIGHSRFGSDDQGGPLISNDKYSRN